MKLAFIAPTKYIGRFSGRGDFILALSHLLEDEPNECEAEILKTGLPIILDNGLFENGKPEPVESLIKKALRIKATHFFAPDHLRDSEKTLLEAERAWELTKGLNIKIAVVIQGKNKKDWFDLYKKIAQDDRFDMIGLSILAIPYIYQLPITESRIQCMKDLALLEEVGFLNNKKCHLLGLGDSYRDVLYARDYCPWVVSNDTSSPVWNGFMGKSIDFNLAVESGKSRIPVDFNYEPSDTGLMLAEKNINIVKSYAN